MPCGCPLPVNKLDEALCVWQSACCRSGLTLEVCITCCKPCSSELRDPAAQNAAPHQLRSCRQSFANSRMGHALSCTSGYLMMWWLCLSLRVSLLRTQGGCVSVMGAHTCSNSAGVHNTTAAEPPCHNTMLCTCHAELFCQCFPSGWSAVRPTG